MAFAHNNVLLLSVCLSMFLFFFSVSNEADCIHALFFSFSGTNFYTGGDAATWMVFNFDPVYILHSICTHPNYFLWR